jgi:hypothetical protein
MPCRHHSLRPGSSNSKHLRLKQQQQQQHTKEQHSDLGAATQGARMLTGNRFTYAVLLRVHEAGQAGHSLGCAVGFRIQEWLHVVDTRARMHVRGCLELGPAARNCEVHKPSKAAVLQQRTLPKPTHPHPLSASPPTPPPTPPPLNPPPHPPPPTHTLRESTRTWCPNSVST